MNQVGIKRRQIQAFSYILGLAGIIIFGNLLGDNGIAYVFVAYECFMLLWTFAGRCTSDICGRMLRTKSNPKAQYKNIPQARNRIMTIHVAMGIVGAVIFAAVSFWLLNDVLLMKNATVVALAMIPAFLLRSVNSALLGFFQGDGTELPTAITSIIRVFFTMLLGFVLATLLKDYGAKVSALLIQPDFEGMYGALGLAMGLTFAEIIVSVFLFILRKKSSVGKKGLYDGLRNVESVFGIAKIMYVNMIGMILVYLLRDMPLLLGAFLYQREQYYVKGAVMSSMSPDDYLLYVSNVQYGAYAGSYLALMFIVILVIDIILVSQSAKVYGYYKRSDVKLARTGFQGGVHIAFVWGIYASVIIAALAGQISEIICNTDSELTANMLRGGAFLILFVVLADYFGRLLYLSDRRFLVFAGLAVMDVFFVIFTLITLNMQSWGIMSLVYGGEAAVAVLCLFYGFFALNNYGIGVDVIQSIVIPAVGASVAGLISLFMGKLITPHLGAIFSVIICITVTFIIYIVFLLIVHNFREQELKVTSGSKVFMALGRLFNLL